MAFCRNKMQDLVLYKNRCDNRLNEITERAIADKREAEMLAKKYEEKYKQVAEVASKLTIEEASFRDIQERKMELNQALVKMDQGGSADGILQVLADRIQSDLKELLKALTERCKKHGTGVTVIGLPKGWEAAGSPTEQKIFESPTKEDPFNHLGKSFDADTERGFDDQGFGTFDNNVDVDTVKDAEHGKHGEIYFFESNSFTASPGKSDSPQGNNSFFQKKSPFGFDDSVPGSPASRAGTSPRYRGGGAEILSLIISRDTTLLVPLTEVLPNKKPSRDLIP